MPEKREIGKAKNYSRKTGEPLWLVFAPSHEPELEPRFWSSFRGSALSAFSFRFRFPAFALSAFLMT